MMQNSASIAAALKNITARIRTAEANYGRTPGTVQLLAVSKTKPAAMIRAAYVAGQRRFGESYLQEALEKMTQLADLECEWHFIGPLQSNKTRAVAERFAWLHSLDRHKTAERLNAQRPQHLSPLNVCIQINISGEDSKAGIDAEELPRLAEAVARLPRLRLRGLMTIPAVTSNFEKQRRAFAELARLQQNLIRSGFDCDTLSMGMTDDLEAAIAEGATMVRVGTAIFGARPN